MSENTTTTMIDEDVINLIALLSQRDPKMPVMLPGAICSVGEFLGVLHEAAQHRGLK